MKKTLVSVESFLAGMLGYDPRNSFVLHPNALPPVERKGHIYSDVKPKHGRYTGADLREIRARNGVGRPPKKERI